MDDPVDVLDCALRSGYLALSDLPGTTFWHKMPDELREALGGAIVAGQDLNSVVPLIWQIRATLYGRAEPSSERTQATARLRIGFLYLRFREGRIGMKEALARSCQVIDSYVCDLDAKPFHRLRRELAAGGGAIPLENRAAEVFAPYETDAAESVRRWGLRAIGK